MLLAGLVLTAVVAPMQEVKAGAPTILWGTASIVSGLLSINALKEAHKHFLLARVAIEKNSDQQEHDNSFCLGVLHTGFLVLLTRLGVIATNNFFKS